MKISHKFISLFLIAIGPGAAIAAAAAASGASPFSPDILSATCAIVGLQLVAMTDHGRRSAARLASAAHPAGSAVNAPVAGANVASGLRRRTCVAA